MGFARTEKYYYADSIKSQIAQDKTGSIKVICEEFEKYWISKNSHEMFGKNVANTSPSSSLEAAIAHVHISPFSPQLNRFKRNQKEKTSNKFLLYSVLSNGGVLLLAVLNDNAHQIITSLDYMSKLIKFAEEEFVKIGCAPVNKNILNEILS